MGLRPGILKNWTDCLLMLFGEFLQNFRQSAPNFNWGMNGGLIKYKREGKKDV
jgi:hypothetical protein